MPAGGGGVGGTKALQVDAAVNDADFGEVALHGRADAALGLGRVRLVGAFAQHFGDEVRHGDKGIALGEEEAAAGPGAGAFGQVACQNNFWADAERRAAMTVGQRSRPWWPWTIWARSRAEETRGAQDEAGFAGRGAGVNKRDPQFVDGFLKRPAGGAGEDDALMEAMQFSGELDALVIGAAAGQQGIQMDDAQGGRRGHDGLRLSVKY